MPVEAPQKPKTKPPFGTFQLNHGIHIETGCDGVEHFYRAVPGQQGPIFESPDNLNALNGVGMTPKFTQLNGTGQPVNTVRPLTPASREKLNTLQIKALEVMSLDELRKFAAEEEIELGAAKTKDEVLKIVKTALGA